jgi:putative ABC transport system permease protein
VGIKTLVRALWRSPAGPLLLAAQVALSLMIVSNVSYVVYVRLETTARPTGMDIGNIFWISARAYGKSYDAAAGTKIDIEYLNSLPDVVAACATNAVPQTFDSIRSLTSPNPELKGSQRLAVIYRMTDRFIDTLGLHLLRGRAPAGAILPHIVGIGDPPKNTLGGEIVITEALADRLFGGGPAALGKPLYFSLLNGGSATVVGIIEQMQGAPYFGPESEFVNELVLTATYQPALDELYLVRTRSGTRDHVISQVQREFGSVQPGRYQDRIETFARTAAMARTDDRINAITLLVLSSLVVAVTMLGLFGFAAFAVTGRMKEIGIRRAIGATSGDITKQFLTENWLITTPGIVIGCIITLAFALQLSLLMELPRLPILFLIGTMILIWAAGLLAALHPARRAGRVPPAVATRVA